MIKWQRDADTFARRIVHSDLRDFLGRGFIVEQGTKALFFENGVLREVVRAGKIETGGLLTRLLTLDFHRRVEIVVCEAGDIQLAYLYGGENSQTKEFHSPVRSAEHIPLQTGVEIVFQLVTPELFMNNVFQGRESLPMVVLKGHYFQEIRDALQQFCSQIKIAEIASGRECKDRCAAALEKHLALSLARDGFRLIQVRSLAMYNPQWAELHRQKACIEIAGARQSLEFEAKHAELEQRERQLELAQREQQLAVVEARHSGQQQLAMEAVADQTRLERDRRQVENYQCQSRLWQELRRAENQERIHRARSEAELATVLDEIDSAGAMRRRDKDELLRQWREHDEDHQRQRAVLTAQMEMEHRYALAAEQLSQDQALSERQLQLAIKRQRQQLEHELAVEKARLAVELENRRLRQIAEVEAKDREQIAELECKKRELAFAGDRTRAEAEMAEIEMQIQEKRAKNGLRINEEFLAQKRRDLYERQKIDVEIEQGHLQLQLQREENELQRQLALRREDRSDRREEYDHQRALRELEIRTTTIESDRDVAIAQAQLSGKEKEAIIAEKERQLEIYSQFQQALSAQNHSNADRLERMFNKSLDRISNIASDRTAPNSPPPYPEQQSSPPLPTAPQGLRICTACGVQVEVGIKFCENCGNQLR